MTVEIGRKHMSTKSDTTSVILVLLFAVLNAGHCSSYSAPN